MRLTVEDQRIDRAPDIVNRGVMDDLNLIRTIGPALAKADAGPISWMG